MDEFLFYAGPAYEKNYLFEEGNPARNPSNIWRAFYELASDLQKKGVKANTMDVGDFSSAKALVFLEMPEAQNPYFQKAVQMGLKEKMHLLLLESPVVRPADYEPAAHAPFSKILTWRDDLVDGKRYLKINLSMPYKVDEPIPCAAPAFASRKLLCLISANKYFDHPDQLYTERTRAARFMEKSHPTDFDLFGHGWDLPVVHSKLANGIGVNRVARLLGKLGKNSPTRVSPRWYYPSNGGALGKNDKIKVLHGYKFSICYENHHNVQGYITEKIFDCFVGGNVPVYWGADNIEAHVPKACFIDKRKFTTYEELYQYLHGMEEKEYNEYLAAIRQFMNGSKSAPFKIDFFIKQMESLLE